MKPLFKSLLGSQEQMLSIAQEYKNIAGISKVEAFIEANGWNEGEKQFILNSLL